MRETVSAPRSAQWNFVRQQGFRNAAAEGCDLQYDSLMLQPRIVGAVVLIALILQSWPIFLALSAVLWWNVLVPGLNPFDALHNAIYARRGRPRLGPAPAPRRFAQGMAASFMAGIGLSLAAGFLVLAWVLEALLVVALAALTFGKFCLGSFIYHLLRGERDFARRTLPWAGGEET